VIDFAGRGVVDYIKEGFNIYYRNLGECRSYGG